MLEMSVTEAAWGLTSFVFSIRSDVTNDSSSKRRKIHGAYIKSFKGSTGKFPEPQWATTPLPCLDKTEKMWSKYVVVNNGELMPSDQIYFGCNKFSQGKREICNRKIRESSDYLGERTVLE